MPKTLDSYLADKTLTRQLYLMRFSAGEQKKVLAVLVDMRAELVARLRTGNGDLSDFARGRLKTLLKQCEAVIDHGYGQIQTALTDNHSPGSKARAQATISRTTATKGGNNFATGEASMKAYEAAGFKPLPGFQLRYIYFLDPTAKDRLTVPILPFSEIERRGAGMYKGIKRDKQAIGPDQGHSGGAAPTVTLQKKVKP